MGVHPTTQTGLRSPSLSVSQYAKKPNRREALTSRAISPRKCSRHRQRPISGCSASRKDEPQHSSATQATDIGHTISTEQAKQRGLAYLRTSATPGVVPPPDYTREETSRDLLRCSPRLHLGIPGLRPGPRLARAYAIQWRTTTREYTNWVMVVRFTSQTKTVLQRRPWP